MTTLMKGVHNGIVLLVNKPKFLVSQNVRADTKNCTFWTISGSSEKAFRDIPKRKKTKSERPFRAIPKRFLASKSGFREKRFGTFRNAKKKSLKHYFGGSRNAFSGNSETHSLGP